MSRRPFAFFTDIDKQVVVSRFLHLLILLDIDLPHSRLRVIHQLEKSLIVLLSL